MSYTLLVSIGFGMVVIAMAFKVLVFVRAFVDPAEHFDKRYRIVAAAMAISSAGVMLWAINPLSQAFGGPPLHVVAMVLASMMLLGSAAAIVGSTAVGGDPHTLYWFLGTSGVWTILCILWWTL